MAYRYALLSFIDASLKHRFSMSLSGVALSLFIYFTYVLA